MPLPPQSTHCPSDVCLLCLQQSDTTAVSVRCADSEGNVWRQEACRVESVVDTTGAGGQAGRLS